MGAKHQELPSRPASGLLANLLDPLVERVGDAESIDGVAGPMADQVARRRPAALTGLLAGTWLGHPVHPILTDLPIGFWTSAWMLDVVGGRSRRAAAQTLVGLGVLSAVPTAATGASDWADTVGRERRVGFAHAAVNTAGVACFALSWLARRRGRHGLGVALGMAGATAATAAAYFGGHLVYRTGTGVDVNVFDQPAGDWAPLEPLEGADTSGPYFGASTDDVELLVVKADSDSGYSVGGGERAGDRWEAIGDKCSHRGGPLHEGTVGHGCATCPWHGSQFRTSDGAVLRGPAVSPQPAYDVRPRGDGFEARPRP